MIKTILKWKLAGMRNIFRSKNISPSLNDKTLIIGLGSGRSGTSSLAKLLDSQPDTSMHHESKPILPWIYNETLLNKKLSQICEQNTSIVGEVASYFLPYVENIIKIKSDAKFICLKRDKQKTVTSFMKKTDGFNHWSTVKKDNWIITYFDQAFPKYDALEKEEAIAKYWDEYYKTAENLQSKYPSNFRIYDLAILSDLTMQNEIFEFLGVKNFNPVNVHENKIRPKSK